VSRAAVVVAAVAGAFALAAPAFAAYRPTLLVTPARAGLGQAGAVVISFAQRADDDATAALTVLVPGEYGTNVAQAPGTRVGSATARIATQFLGGTPIPVSGRIVAGDPLEAAVAAAACGVAPGTAPLALTVWLVQLATQTGQSVVVRVLVYRSTSGLRLQVCLPSPYVPEAQGGAPFGVKLLSAELTVDGIFGNPQSRGRYAWQGLFTPYVPGTATHGTTVEARAIVPVPARVTLVRRLVGRRRARRVVLRGAVTEAGAGVRAVRVELHAAANPRASARRVAVARTRARGRFTFTRPLAGARWYRVVVPARDATSSGCGAPVAPGGCVSAVVPALESPLVQAPARQR
jgi:hypothetical protein